MVGPTLSGTTGGVQAANPVALCKIVNLDIQHVTSLGEFDASWGPSGIRVGSVPAPTSFTSGAMRIRPRDPNPEIAPDGQGGVLVAWLESPPFSADSVAVLRVQRVASSGEALWDAGGVSASRAPGEHRFPLLWPDGAGGACVLWEENPDDGSPMRLWGQHLSAAGALSWGPAGRPLASEPAGNSDHRIASDSLGGAIAIWSTTQGGRTGVFARRFRLDGTPSWPASLVVAESVAASPEPRVAIGSTGVVWATWLSRGSPCGPVVVAEIPEDLGAARPTSVLLGDTMAASISNPRIVGDGCGGAFTSWLEGTFAPRVSHVSRDRSGAVVDGNWTREGSRLDDAVGGAQTNELLPGLAGQAFLAWGHRRDLPTGDDEIRLQYLCLAGVGNVCIAAPSPPATRGEITLERVAPNPSVGPLTVGFALTCEADVEVELLDIAGRRPFARRLGRLSAGRHVLHLGTELPALPGSYLLRLRSNRHSIATRVVLIR